MKKTNHKYQGKEDDFQIGCVKYLQNIFPDLLFIHVPNGGKRSKAEGGRFKAMGVKPGVNDILIFDAKAPYNGLAIELKVDGGTVSESQKEFHKQIKSKGWKVEIVWNYDDFQTAIVNYLTQQ